MIESNPHRIPDFLVRCGLQKFQRIPLAGDASHRRYERILTPSQNFVLMDTPNPKEDIVAFKEVDHVLMDIDLSAPKIERAEPEEGLALLEDFGDDTFGRLLDKGYEASFLYGLGTETLIFLHQRFKVEHWKRLNLPVYDLQNFINQVMLFVDVGLPLLECSVPADARMHFKKAWEEVVPLALNVPQSLLLRDYQPDNLMLLQGRPGVKACGLLDFQQAGLGPISYDLVSLLEEARRDVPEGLVESLIQNYFKAFPQVSEKDFRRSYSILGALRHTRIIGIFLRLGAQSGKSRYRLHLPRVWSLLNKHLQAPYMAPVQDWFQTYLSRGHDVAAL